MLPLIWLFLSLQISNGMSIPTLKFSNGNKIPLLGFGTALIDESKLEDSIASALANGYRHFDTAFTYNNERSIGNALKNWLTNGGKREELFISTKLPQFAMRPSDVEDAVNLSMNNLGVDYLDMYLIHVPFGFKRTKDFDFLRYENGSAVLDPDSDISGVWRKLEKQVKAGKIKSIGVCNFNKTQILKLWEEAEIKPVNLQVETNVYIQQDELHKLCKELGIVMTAYSPLGSGDLLTGGIELVTPIRHPIVKKIAEAHNKSPAQILLRFNVQRNITIIPKSSNPDRIKENIEIFDFELTQEETNELSTLDQHGRYRKFDFIDIFDGVQYHPEYPFADVLGTL